MKRQLKKLIVAMLILVMSMGLLTGTALAADEDDDARISVLRSDLEIEDITMEGAFYIAEGVTLTTTGTVTIDGDVYVYGTWKNTGDIAGEGTIHCAHYNSLSLPANARGVFTNTHDTTRVGNAVQITTSSAYLSDPVPEGHTWEPDAEPDTDPEPDTEPGPETTPDGLQRGTDGNWYYYKDGEIDTAYTGFAENENGKWYVESGQVTFGKDSVIRDDTGAIGNAGTWYYVVGSQVQSGFTGLANYSNENGWWYIVEGVVDFNHNGVDKNNNGWWYVAGGKVDFNANTVARNSNGWWYILGGQVQFDFTGLADYSNENGWWYIQNGKVDFSHNGVDKNKNGWWYVLGGQVQFDFTGLADYSNANGWWYIVNGKVDFTYNGTAKNKNGTWDVVNGKVRF